MTLPPSSNRKRSPSTSLRTTTRPRRISEIGHPPLRSLEPAAARWISALIRVASTHPAMTRILDVIERLQARPFCTNAILCGPPGTGKEGLARALHALMTPAAPLVRLDTNGLSDEEALTLLCGSGRSPGLAEAANGGCLLIEEAGALPPRTQGELLRILKTGQVVRQGDSSRTARPGRINALALTDLDLPALVTARRFRHDLYYRLARIVLWLPPLDERTEDIGPAAVWMGNRILRDAGVPLSLLGKEDYARAAPEEKRRAIELTSEALAVLCAHSWTGNFRELEAVLERALLLYRTGGALDAEAVKSALDTGAQPPNRE